MNTEINSDPRTPAVAGVAGEDGTRGLRFDRRTALRALTAGGIGVGVASVAAGSGQGLPGAASARGVATGYTGGSPALVIGTVQDLSAAGVAHSRQIVTGMRAAIAAANAAGGNVRYDLVVADGAGDPAQVHRATQRLLVEHRPDAMVGSFGMAAISIVAPLCATAEVPFRFPLGSGPRGMARVAALQGERLDHHPGEPDWHTYGRLAVQQVLGELTAL